MADPRIIVDFLYAIYQAVEQARRNKEELSTLVQLLREQVEPLMQELQQTRSVCPPVQKALDLLGTSVQKANDFVAKKGQTLNPYDVQKEIAAVTADVMTKVNNVRANIEVSLYKDLHDLAEFAREVREVAAQLNSAWKRGKGAYGQLKDQLRAGAESARNSAAKARNRLR